ncbi:MAG: hypothetical protein OXH52_03480 [Gammaproteobacteria bacterium]|nr:hypothetical protein [Gammaproteobacteria bacterium]
MLRHRGRARTRQDCEAYVRDPTAYVTGRRKLTFDASIFGAAAVKEDLERLQHNKCCYCERRTSGRIDHFRPKGAVRQSRGSDRLRPGYYWLAYGWNNLVLACEDCNLKKSDYFPLEDPGRRARSHLDSLDGEAPMLLNPYVERDPAQHLAFEGSACRPRTERGRVTVAVLGLNRPSLQEERQEVLSMLAHLSAVARHPEVPDTLRQEAREMMDGFARADARYSAMVRDYLSGAD